ncbi:TauD-domain-containing protein [Corynespora cassiicola Philippines]|uniref:TauD-domain-containing protein n=1 Tax=Corynespora cassiicola Philippines TaxID=1448308 RepID=A0A2T2PAY8_CORCC|nr:TauD-domain-containing protein [Corynespora cassiicola Philippines]
MAFHQSRKRTSARSGPIASQTTATKITNETINSQEPELQNGGKERALLADPDKKSLLSVATRTDLFESIGTLLSNVQLSSLNSQQLDELALLVSERGVVFFRNQNLSADGQARITQHYETIYPSPSPKRKDSFQDEEKPVKAYANSTAAKEIGSLDFESQKEWHATKSYEVNPPSYSLLRTGESSGVAAWVSQYGLYDDLSKHWRGFLDGLHAEHTSRLQDESQPIVENQHPAIRTHPVTGLKTLNVTPGVVSGFAELKKKESESLLKFLDYHINSSDEHSVRFKLEPGSVAIWDNRSTAHKLISKSGPTGALGTETTVSGEKPYFNVQSESRQEKTERVAREEQERIRRRKEAKARYNNTPLRRIIQRQVLKQDKRGLCAKIHPR